MMMQRNGLVLALLVLSLGLTLVNAQDTVTRRVEFKPGASLATITGSLKGRQDHDYVLRARAGQTMHLQMSSKNTLLYFNVLHGATQETLFVGQGAAEPHSWTGKLPSDGDYIIRVYFVRAEARRGGSADFQFSVSITN